MNRFHRRNLAAAALIVFLVLSVSPAQADIAPPSPPAGTNLQPGMETTNVRMVAETVILDIPSYSTYPNGHAVVTATFQMRNLGNISEQMDVRFPLCLADEGYSELFFNDFSDYPAIDQFAVWVDGSPVPVAEIKKEVYQRVNDEWAYVDVPCWAHFPISFPPQQDVMVKVQYRQPGGIGPFEHGLTSFTRFDYVLFTGAGWHGTIGSADIVARLPVEATELTPYLSQTEYAEIMGKEIRWHFEDIEPGEDLRGITFVFLQPAYWMRIQEARARTAAHPQDGEAWGQLGKAIKDAYKLEHGFMDDTLYEESAAAYQKAVTLLPSDADWHFGYADLVCNSTFWKYIGEDYEGLVEPIKLCMDQLNQTITLNPEHDGAAELKSYLPFSEWNNAFQAGLNTPTTTPTPTITRTITRFPTWTPKSPTTSTWTPEPPLAATMAQVQPESTPSPVMLVLNPSATLPPNDRVEVCGARLLPAALVVLFAFRRRR